MSRVLVTGGAGFIGSHLVDRLIKGKHQVVVADDLSGGFRKNVHAGAKLYKADCRNYRAVERIFHTVKPEIVYHLAANAAENKAQFSPIDITSRNYDAFIKVLTAAIRHDAKRFIFTSSIAVYGCGQAPFKETDKPEPEDLYGVTKLAAEQSLAIMSTVHGIEYVVARPHNVYGPRQNMRDPYRNVVTIWMNALLRQEPYYIYGDGYQVRCFSYIDDVIEPLYQVGFLDKAAGKTFNIGADHYCTLNYLSRRIQEVTGMRQKPEYLPKRQQEVHQVIADHTLARHYLKTSSKTRLVDGLAKTWRWVKKQGPQPLLYTPIEIPSTKLPANWNKP